MGLFWTPNCVVGGNKEIFEGVPESVKSFAREKLQEGWRYYAVDQSRGRCYYDNKAITIPLWVIKSNKPGKKIWYVSHELAHVYAGSNAMHGPKFMEWLKKICPEEHQHWELGYKPRNALSAGITFNKDFL